MYGLYLSARVIPSTLFSLFAWKPHRARAVYSQYMKYYWYSVPTATYIYWRTQIFYHSALHSPIVSRDAGHFRKRGWHDCMNVAEAVMTCNDRKMSIKLTYSSWIQKWYSRLWMCLLSTRYTEEKTSDVIEYGALLRLMGDMFQHRYSNHHHRWSSVTTAYHPWTLLIIRDNSSSPVTIADHPWPLQNIRNHCRSPVTISLIIRDHRCLHGSMMMLL